MVIIFRLNRKQHSLQCGYLPYFLRQLMKHILIVLLLCIAPNLVRAQSAQIPVAEARQVQRLWRSLNGDFSRYGTLISYSADSCVIETDNGVSLNVKLSKLSLLDQKIVQALSPTTKFDFDVQTPCESRQVNRVWRSIDGNYSVRGSLVSYSTTSCKISRVTDGKILSIQLSKLHPDDRAIVDGLNFPNAALLSAAQPTAVGGSKLSYTERNKRKTASEARKREQLAKRRKTLEARANNKRRALASSRSRYSYSSRSSGNNTHWVSGHWRTSSKGNRHWVAGHWRTR